jgi:hypothetical protein
MRAAASRSSVSPPLGIDRRLVNVPVDVEPVVVDPQRPAQQRSREVHPAPELWRVPETPIEFLGDLVRSRPARAAGQRRAVEHGQAAEVARPCRTLDPKKHQVKEAQAREPAGRPVTRRAASRDAGVHWPVPSQAGSIGVMIPARSSSAAAASRHRSSR